MGDRIPLPMPRGWFCVAESADLEPEEVRPLHAFGRELVLFCDAAGRPHLLDAHCPHLGAHLGHGGRVVDGTLRCPFHGWRFDGEGRCVEVPYARRIPPAARLRSWPLCERNGLVFTWFDPEGGAPSYEIPEVPEWGAPGWTAPEKRVFRVRSHPQEMAENTVDPAHFHVVHGTPRRPEMEARIEGAVLRATQGLTFTTPQGEVEGRVDIEAHGPGFGVTRFHGIVETLLLVTGIPLDDELHQTTLRMSVRRIEGNEAATRGVARAFLAELERQYAQDIPIWENKRYLERPLLCDGDGPIALVRRFYRQFYPSG